MSSNESAEIEPELIEGLPAPDEENYTPTKTDGMGSARAMEITDDIEVRDLQPAVHRIRKPYWLIIFVFLFFMVTGLIIIIGRHDMKQMKHQFPINEGLTEETVSGGLNTRLLGLSISEFATILEEPTTEEFVAMDDGTQITLRVGETLYYRFDENPSTGYMMIQDTSVDGGLFEVESRFEANEVLYNYLDHPLVGAGGLRLFSVTGTERGEGVFRVAYARAWEYVDWESHVGTKFSFPVTVI